MTSPLNVGSGSRRSNDSQVPALFPVPAESAALLLGGLLQQGQASPSIMVTARRQDSVQEAHGCRIGGPEGGRFNGNEEAPDGQSA